MNALIPIAEGSESLEAVTIANILRRGGVEVTIASTGRELTVPATRGIRLVADAFFADVAGKDFDLIVVPGGETGAENLGACAALVDRLRAQRKAKKWYGAICAAPALTLSPHGLLDGKQATCYPAFKDKLLHFVDRPVVVDGHCITSQGPATAIAFSLQLLELLCGQQKSREVGSSMLLDN